jgi:hypothetical protein
MFFPQISFTPLLHFCDLFSSTCNFLLKLTRIFVNHSKCKPFLVSIEGNGAWLIKVVAAKILHINLQCHDFGFRVLGKMVIKKILIFFDKFLVFCKYFGRE